MLDPSLASFGLPKGRVDVCWANGFCVVPLVKILVQRRRRSLQFRVADGRHRIVPKLRIAPLAKHASIWGMLVAVNFGRMTRGANSELRLNSSLSRNLSRFTDFSKLPSRQTAE
ncbi:hypothetical protein SAMN06265222_101475 [Neorhodopirellula lusitana]|uniref:Uncharacterized protein n=1 Tax=Neorhodopirellula lusitana TaxID=445327 RepID=A0ABY1PSF9_9BACT|nr:hypothetical protein SAMN06265222_101475 [Neorhodopirellula lusitana]